MKEKQKKISQLNWGLNIFIILGIIAVLNFLSYQLFFRWDLTAGNDYSISKTSRDVAAELDDIVSIKAYFSSNLPPQFINLRQEVADILDEYQNYSKSKVRVEFISPADDEDTMRELAQKGIPQLQFNTIEKDKLEVVKGYVGVLISQGGREEVIPAIQNTKNLEYQLTIAIKKVTDDETPAIGFVSSHGAKDDTSGLGAAFKELERIYEIKKIDLAGEEKEVKIDPSIKTLVIAGASEKFTEDQLKAIDKFVIGGGSLLVMADGIEISEGLAAKPSDNNISELLSKYGIILNKNLAVDYSSNGQASFNQGFAVFTVNYPYWPRITNAGFDQDNAAVAKLESLVLPWVSDIAFDSGKLDDSARTASIAKTSVNSGLVKDQFNLAPFGNVASVDKGEKTLAVSLSGKLKSAYGQGEAENARIMVVGDSDFAQDNFLRQYPDNLIFFQNIVDSLSLDDDLINIRSKGISERPIKELSDSLRATARYANVFGITALVIIFGVARYTLRRRSRYSDEF